MAVNTSLREPGSYSGRDKERFTSGGRLRKSYEYVILDIEHIRSILARPHLGIRNTSTCTRGGYRHSFRRRGGDKIGGGKVDSVRERIEGKRIA